MKECNNIKYVNGNGKCVNWACPFVKVGGGCLKGINPCDISDPTVKKRSWNAQTYSMHKKGKSM